MHDSTQAALAQTTHQAIAPRACETVDPRIRRTRELLQQALRDLLIKKDFEHISVHEITDAAGVNRATFYAHYNDRFALLECMVATRFLALLDERGIIIQGGCTHALRGLVTGLYDFLVQATGPRSDPATRTLQPHMETAIVSVLRRMISEGMASQDAALQETGFSPAVGPDIQEGALDPEAAMRSAAIAWAIYGATREALNTPSPIPVDSIAATVVGLIEPLFPPRHSSSSRP